MVAEGYDIKGEILFERKRFMEALKYFETALEINKDAQDSTFNATAQISIGRCYQNLGQLDRALNAYTGALPITKAMDVKENLRTIYKNMSVIYERKGDLNRSLTYFKDFTAVKDSIYVNEKSREFADMQTKYDTERKEQELALKEQEITILEQRNEIQDLLRMRLIVTIFVILVFALLGLYTLWLRLKRNKLQQEVETQRLEHELELKKRELATHTLHIIQKNELLENLQNKVTELNKKETGASYHEITRLIKTNRLIDKDWENFKSVFEQVHPDFFIKLKSKYKSISANELRMAAMMKMNLNTKEMAAILNITPESVKKARYRMRKKLELESEANVNEYLMKF
jgi:tetratricopeptide (TPR) repeat protein